MLLRSGVLNIYGPLERADTRRIASATPDARGLQLQFARRFDVSAATLENLDRDVLAVLPDQSLRETLNGHGAFDSLDFLRHLPHLRGLNAQGNRPIDLSPVQGHPTLEALTIGGLGTPLTPLRGGSRLRHLGIAERVKSLEVIAGLPSLQSVTFLGQTLKSLAFLEPLPSLRTLSLSLGGTRELATLARLANLEELELWRIRQLEAQHVLPLNQAPRLRTLRLRELPRITGLDWLRNPSLTCLELEGMTGLDSYASLRGGLKTLVLKDEVDEERLASLSALTSLEEVRVPASVLPSLSARPWPFTLKPLR